MSRVTVLAMIALTALAGCGADGDPVKPSLNASVAVGSDGVYTRGGVGLRQGPLSLYLGF